MRARRTGSLTLKLTVPLVVITALVAASASWHSSRDYAGSLQRESEKRGVTIARAVEDTAAIADVQGLRRAVSALGAGRDVTAIVVVAGRPARVVAATRNAFIGRSLDGLPHDVRAGITDSEGPFGRSATFEHGGNRLELTWRLLVRDRSTDGADFRDMAAYVELDLSAIKHDITRASTDNFALVILAVVLVALGAFAVFRLVVTRRLGAISAAIARRAAGDPNALAPECGSDAIGRLGHALNAALTAATDSERRTRAIVETAAEGIITIDDHGRVESCNAAAARMFGYRAEDLIGDSIVVLMPEPYREPHLAGLARRRAGGTQAAVLDVELEGLRKDGTTFPLSLSVSEVLAGDRTTYAGILRDNSERRAFEVQLEHQATHDPLTGLPNRMLLLDRLGQALARAARSGNATAVLFIDLDRFKVVNDGLGHDAGDRLLAEVARRFRDSVRAFDTVARFGGDEFVVLCDEIDDTATLVALARRVAGALQHPFVLDDTELRVTASTGIALAEGTDTPTDLLRKADVAMYRAKASGGDDFAIFDETMQAWADARLDTESALRGAIGRGELRVHYQPIYQLPGGGVSGVEALVRWERPGIGLVPPAQFIGVAEEIGAIVEIGTWVLEEACDQAVRWQRDHHAADLSMSVNVSTRQLGHADFVDSVAAALARTGLDPARLVLEITESVLVDDAAKAETVLRDLKALGVRLALDDFGTGHSSLVYLLRFPIDVLKVDRSFVHEMTSTGDGSTIVGSVISLAHGLGMTVVAEGVETAEHLEALARLGCDYAQGFHLAHPEPPSVVSDLLDAAAAAPASGAR